MDSKDTEHCCKIHLGRTIAALHKHPHSLTCPSCHVFLIDHLAKLLLSATCPSHVIPWSRGHVYESNSGNKCRRMHATVPQLVTF